MNKLNIEILDKKGNFIFQQRELELLNLEKVMLKIFLTINHYQALNIWILKIKIKMLKMIKWKIKSNQCLKHNINIILPIKTKVFSKMIIIAEM